MVLFKRKPVTYPVPPILPENINIRCWWIPVTKEWFTDYNEYLKRMDYYKTRKFVCEITGNSCLTFFEAYESEVKEMRLVEKYFPEHLKEPILRHIQFSTVPRIDQLVDEVYTFFKTDYYPGETVVVRLNDYRNDFKARCVIREKAKFNAIYNSERELLRPAYTQYRVCRVDDGNEIVVDHSQITRDRNNFTKWFVKAFIKLCVTRSAKIGAPWLVKKKYADHYKIPTELPPELSHFKDEPKNPNKRRKLVDLRPKVDDASSPRSSTAPDGRKGTPDTKSRQKGASTWRKTMSVSQSKAGSTTTPPPPPVKKTIQEDLLNPFDLTVQKPMPHLLEELGEFVPDALESWAFLNVYRTPLALDTFTFDDFLTAMKWNDHHRCPLQDEIFCSVLSGFCKVGSKSLDFELPEEYDSDVEGHHSDKEDDNDDDENENGGEENDDVSNSQKSDMKIENGSNVKSSDQVKNDNSDDDSDRSTELNSDSKDRAKKESFYADDTNKIDQYLNYRGQTYLERLSKRNFKDGGWQIIMLGILDEVSSFKGWKEHIKEIFDYLAPLSSAVNNNALLTHFQDLNPGLKVRALNILCTLLVNSPVIRAFLEKCMEDSTSLRRDRLEIIKKYKVAYENAQNADKELRVLMSAPTAASTSTNAPTEEPSETKKLRRRAAISIEPSEEELAFAKTNTEFANLLATRTAELKIAEEQRILRRNNEKELVMLDVQRIRYIGKDRLYNRYWWFENNGLPNLGGSKSAHDEDDEGDEDAGADDDDDDDDELQEETYLMGRLWVQGPSEEDLVTGLKIKEESLRKWRQVTGKAKTEEDGEKEGEGGKEIDGAVKEENTNGKPIPEENGDRTLDENATQDEIKPILSSKLPPKFVEAAESVFDIKFDLNEKKIKRASDSRILVDEYGATVAGISPEQRKIIEEHPDPLLTGFDWRFYDSIEEIERLMKWLNTWGKRENKLLKELNLVKDRVISSIEARRKALKLDVKTPEEQDLINTIRDTTISETEVDTDNDDDYDDDQDGEDEEDDEEDDENIESEPVEIPRTRRSIANAEKLAEERRKKEEDLKEKLAEKEAKRLKSRPAARIARRQEKKRKRKEHLRKRQLLDESKAKLQIIRDEMENNHCLEWVNSSAIEKLGYFHYDGPKKPRGRPAKPK